MACRSAWLSGRTDPLGRSSSKGQDRELVIRMLLPGDVVERSLAWLVGYRRLQVRYQRRADVLLGFLFLACALICLNSPSR
jgi:hypothetical protein